MAIWIERTFPHDGWSHVHDAFESQFDALGGPRDMMLVKVARHDQMFCQLIVALPHAGLANVYEGFCEITPEQLPRRASLVMGHQDVFNELFMPSG
jgi:hypothetical protein